MEQRLFLITKRGYPKREYLIYLYKINSSIPENEVWFDLGKKSDDTLKLIQYCFLGTYRCRYILCHPKTCTVLDKF